MVLNAETAILLGYKFELLSYPVDRLADIGGRVVLQHDHINFESCGEPAEKAQISVAVFLAFATGDLSPPFK